MLSSLLCGVLNFGLGLWITAGPPRMRRDDAVRLNAEG
jgi:hypothetical protein